MKKFIASLLLFSMVNQVCFPLYVVGLTSGPTQPESVGFQQIDQTDLVDLFTGDFKYNIPLMDVDGYPLNLTYNANVSMEQEASWVGLGWNLQVGSITRSVNGVPDDFKNDILSETIKRKPRTTITLRAAPTFELFGKKKKFKDSNFYKKYKDKISPELGIKWSNYDGFGLSMNVGIKPDLFKSNIQLNLGFDSQNGVSATTSMSVMQKYATKNLGDIKVAGNLSFGMNSQGGIQGLSFNTSVDKYSIVSGSTRNRDTYTRGVDPQIKNTYFSFDIAPFGKDAAGANKDLTISGSYSKAELEANSFITPTTGYFYLQNATADAITDFSKDADPVYNEDIKFLPTASLNYDGYAVSSHGLSGSFRPMRNEIAPVGDPQRVSNVGDDDKSNSLSLDFGQGAYFKLGTNLENTTSNSMNSKLKNNYPFTSYAFQEVEQDELFEPVVFKFEDEANIVDKSFYDQIQYDDPIALKVEASDLTKGITGNSPVNLAERKFEDTRMPRSKIIRSFDANSYQEEFGAFVRPSKERNSFSYGYAVTDVGLPNYASHKFRGFEVTDESGTNYGFFMPALNTKKVEVSFSLNINNSTYADQLKHGITNYQLDNANDPTSIKNDETLDNYYSRKSTSAFAHTFLLTHIKSMDYVDVNNDGLTDDDLGNFTEFRYTRTSENYKWRAPYERNTAKLMPGTRLSTDDDKANYSYGEKEIWYVNSVVGKHHIAIFKISPRNDGVGVADEHGGLPSAAQLSDRLFKLDTIKLYNKNDYYANPSTAKVIKTVVFNYDYSLCSGIPNFQKVVNDDISQNGKLTLKAIHIIYGGSNKGMLTPYVFKYNNNQGYSVSNVDRWGNYQDYSNEAFGSGDFPYTFQNSKQNADNFASKWLLSEVTSPGGSVTKVSYESDDYAFVQNRSAMRMYKILGFTDSPNANAEIKSRMGGLGDRDNHYVVVQLSETPIANLEEKLKSTYLAGIEHMAFSVMTRVGKSNTGNDGYDRIKGYAAIDVNGSMVRDAYSCFIKVEPRNVSKVVRINGMMYSIISNAQLNLGRFINPGNNPENSDIENIIRSIRGIIGEIIKLVADPKLVYYDQGVGRLIKPEESWVRLNIGDGQKFGGGARVKKIETHDSWSSMTGGINVKNAVYGQVYEYRIPESPSLSSGVAAYEPFIGGDENPFRQPLYYLATNTFSNKVYDYQELPIAESYFPSPTVGYSHVTVKNLHFEYAPSSREFSISEFYTAKDFPVILQSTDINLITKDPRISPPLFKESSYCASQGVSIITNSMHGKEKATHTFLGTEFNNSRPIQSTRNYYTNLPGGNRNGRDGKLNTLVGRISSGSNEWQEEYLNRHIELIWHPHYFSEMQFTTRFNFDLEVLPAGVLPTPIPVPIFFTPTSSSSTYFISSSLVKHVDYRPILVKTESKSLGKLEEIENYVFDFLGANSILKKVFTGGQRTVVAEVPYHLVTDQRRWQEAPITSPFPSPAYKSINFETELTFNGTLSTFEIPPQNDYIYNDIFDVGDLVVLKPTSGPKVKAWVASVRRLNLNPFVEGCANGLEIQMIDANGVFINSGTYQARIVKKGGGNISGAKCFSFVATEPNLFGPKQYLSYNYVEALPDKSVRVNQGAIGYSQFIANPFRTGQHTGFDFNKTYEFYGERGYSNSLIGMQGELIVPNQSFPYHLASPCQNEYAIVLSNGIINWKNIVKPTKIDIDGAILETKDNEGRYNAASYLAVSRQMNASAKFARSTQILAESFESYYLPIFSGTAPFGHNALGLINYASGSGYKIPTATNPTTAYVSEGAAHTGKYSLRVNANQTHVKNYDKPDASIQTTSATNGVKTPVNLENYNVGFNPWIHPGEYVLSVWVRDANYLRTNSNYGQRVKIKIGTNPETTHLPSGPIVNGWQKIEVSFTLPNNQPNGTDFKISFFGGPNAGWFDDLRIFPKQATMTTYVYDHKNRQLKAMLDENNYATFYEYSQASEMIRVKKETERGIMTIQEQTKSIKLN